MLHFEFSTNTHKLKWLFCTKKTVECMIYNLEIHIIIKLHTAESVIVIIGFAAPN